MAALSLSALTITGHEPTTKFLFTENTADQQVEPDVQHPRLTSCTTILDLSPETLLDVFEHLFTTAPRSTLRSPYNPCHRRGAGGPADIMPIVLVDTMPLVICKKMHNEAISAFYSSHTFHHSLKTTDYLLNLTVHQDKYRPLMKHISADVKLVRLQRTTNEIKMAKRLQHLQQDCHNIRTFTLHIIVSKYSHLDFLEMTGNPNQHIVEVLRSMQPRLDRFSIVTFGPPQAMSQLQSAIAPCKPWLTDSFSEWPYLTITDWEYMILGIRPRTRLSEDRIRAWHTYGNSAKRALEE